MNVTKYFLKAKRGCNFLYYLRQKRRHPQLARLRVYLRALNYSSGAIRYFLDEGEKRLKTCELDRDGVVFDVGGDLGNWAQAIATRYDPIIHCFEPNPQSNQILEKKFEENTSVKIHPFGLFDRTTTAKLSLLGMGSSVMSDSPQYRTCTQQTDVELRDIAEVVKNMELEGIDLFKINIEGSEYPLLFRMIETSLIEKCRVLRIQFHEWYPRAHRLRKRIRSHLRKTHTLEWDYPFVWESWRRK